MWPSMKISEALELLKTRNRKIEDNTYLIYMGRICDNQSTLLDVIGNDKNDVDDDDLLILETEIPELITIQLKSKTKNYGKFEFIKGVNAFNIRLLASKLTGQDCDSICLKLKEEVINDDDIIEEDSLFYISIDDSLKDDKSSSSDSNSDNYDESSIFKFKIIDGDYVILQFHQNVTVKEVKEIFAKDEDIDPCNVTIYFGNIKLNDNIQLKNINFDEKITYLSVKIFNFNKELCHKVKPRKLG